MTLPYRIHDTHNVVILPYTDQVAQLVPHARVYQRGTRRYHILPHRDTEVRLLRNLGVPVEHPIHRQYDWRGTTPFEAQRYTAELMVSHPRAYILNDLGTGKTRASLYAADYLIRRGSIKCVLVVAPLSTLTTVWERELFEVFPDYTVRVLHGPRAKRLSLLEEPADFYIINHDGVKVLLEALMARPDIQAVIIDELAVLRNHRSGRWKTMNKLIKGRNYVWGLTGAPTPKAPTDAYALAKLLTPHTVPPFFNAFRNQVMYQVSQFRWLEREEAPDIVHRALQPAVRYSRDDCVDLPPTTYTTLEVDLTPEQSAAYKKMLAEYAAEFAEGRITAANAGVRASKLVQICAGFAYGQEGLVVDLPAAPRLHTALDVVQEADGKVIVFAPFRHTVSRLAAFLEENGYEVGVINGSVPKRERDALFARFQRGSLPVIVAHPQAMAHGLTLTAANTILWYAPTWDLEIYEQANARITRPGQTRNTHIIHLQGGAVEKRIYKTLQKRGNMQQTLLDLFR